MPTIDIERRELPPTRTAVVRGRAYPGDVSGFLGHAFASVARTLTAQGVAPSGPPFARYHHIGADFEVEAGFPIDGAVTPSDGVVASSLPGGGAAVATFVGSYDRVASAYRELHEWVEAREGHPVGDPWEVYLTDPATSPDPTHWRTEIVLPFAERS